MIKSGKEIPKEKGRQIKLNGNTVGTLKIVHTDSEAGRDLERELVRRWELHDPLVEALQHIIADHEERMQTHADMNGQPHRVKVMKEGRELLEKEII